ncbi:MAG: carboxylesterase family protein, partial [Deltaproteobacteria bacterium]|nr:carboxylesterase family protein [Deltaproteobacteria bacterium]
MRQNMSTVREPRFSYIFLNFFLLLVLASVTAWADENQPREVTTLSGPVVGTVEAEVASYLGIPYAAAPVGDLRFAPPQSREPWTEPFLATQASPSAWQIRSDESSFALPTIAAVSEDSLTLNIWAPEDAKPGDGLPVYFFIHGGGFAQGAGSFPLYDGSVMAKEGIVVVTINYRLGALGFLASRETLRLYGTTGNWGILDQIKALEWVRDNIQAFGGDPNKVTIGGESAG